MEKVYIVAGHTPKGKDKGAHLKISDSSTTNDSLKGKLSIVRGLLNDNKTYSKNFKPISFLHEGELTYCFVQDLAVVLYKDHKIFTYADDKTWSLRNVLNWFKKVRKPRLIIDVHFNASAPSAQGIECFVPKRHTATEVNIAKKIAYAIHSITNSPLRKGGNIPISGVKTEDESQHARIAMLSHRNVSEADNVLIELEFITNPDRMITFLSKYDEIVKVVAKAISDYYN